jgi:four helix bundle protein
LSIPANIVEGFGRRLPRDKARFYNIAEASAGELEYFVLFAGRRKLVTVDLALPLLIIEVQKMLRRLTDITLHGPAPGS